VAYAAHRLFSFEKITAKSIEKSSKILKSLKNYVIIYSNNTLKVVNDFVDKKIGANMKKKIQIDGTIISLYDSPLISNNYIISDFENSDYNIARLVSPLSYQYDYVKFNIALCLQSCFNLKARFRHFVFLSDCRTGFCCFLG